MENRAHLEPSKLPYQLLKQITNDFHEDRILGRGGFGTVYKGVHENHGEIAVKVLRNISGFDDKEFHKEFHSLRGLKHPNIVELVGFCNEWEDVPALYEGKQVIVGRLHLALCLEYVHNGSLDNHISDETTGLTWYTRYKIIKGICEGLKYLREGLEKSIMHFDLKPENVLLDNCMVPKIADFGLSKLFGEENTRQTLSTAGTRGYCPPEYIKYQITSREFDIFSLGVIIVKIMTGHKGYNWVAEMTNRKAIRLVHENWKKKLCEKLSHTSLEVYCNQVKRCIEIALDCLKSNRQERPTIQDIVSRLNETETMIGDNKVQNEQFYQGDGEFTFPYKSRKDIPINYRPTSDNSTENILDVEPTGMSWGLLKEMTDDFSEERCIGQGSTGRIYKGFCGDGQVIAVKKLSKVRLQIDDRWLLNEFVNRKRLHHPNIVQLVGYCHEEEWVIVPYEGRHVNAQQIHAALCFELLGGRSLEQYISPDLCFGRLDWKTQYKIIRGICEGLRYLHEGTDRPVIHKNLRPSKIIIDGPNMVPKIGGLDLDLFSHTSYQPTLRIMDYARYMPPEYIHRAVVAEGYDIFSLGVIFLELMTGRETLKDIHSERFFETAYAKYRERLQETVDGASVEGYCQQIKQCLEIAVKCMEYERRKRPTIAEIIHMLNETEIDPDSELLLEVHPLELQFNSSSSELARKKTSMISSTCSLELKNMGDDHVAFMLVANSPKRYLRKDPFCGVVSPRCSYTLTLTMRNNKQHPPSSSLDIGNVDFFTLYSVGLREYELLSVDGDSILEKYGNFFKKSKEEVQQVTLNVVCDRSTSDQRTSSSELIVTTADAQQVSSIDVHPTEPWILTTNHMGILHVWNYKTMAMLSSFELSAYGPVHVAKFITREKWIVTGDRDGGILVYNYEDEDVESFNAHDSCITTLAVHPTSTFVLSSSEDDDHQIKLWDWGNGWKCTREFEGHTGKVMQVTFNLESNDSFASASLDGTVKVWSICSDDPSNIVTLKLDEHGLCADYFTRLNRQHMIVGCQDKTAQIWELGMKGRVHELEGHEDHISVVSLHPELSVLITGSLGGTIRVWESTTYKLENIIGFNLGAVYAFGCIKGSRRIVVGCHQGIATIEIPPP